MEMVRLTLAEWEELSELDSLFLIEHEIKLQEKQREDIESKSKSISHRGARHLISGSTNG
jgi:ribosomal protein S13